MALLRLANPHTVHVGELEGLSKAGAQTLVLGRENFADLGGRSTLACKFDF